MKTRIIYLICLFLASLTLVSQASAVSAPVITVGRVYHIEGDLLRYIPEEKEWVAMVKDAPFETADALFSANKGMAEMTVPNGTWLRIGNSTQIQFIALEADLSEVDVAVGVARFYNKGAATVIKATSPFGYVLASPGTVFDIYAGERSVEVVAVKGAVSFVHAATDARYEVTADSPSILANASQVSPGDGTIDPDWHGWNTSRDNFWKAKARVTGRSVEYLPANLQSESYALEENGSWESIPYEGSSRWFWRPTTVARGWSPFTVGRWTDWNGDQVWISAEPFGYVTHHYGNWIYVRESWYWAPPVVSERMGHSLLDIGFYWSPGRVLWIDDDKHVGWVPLAPRETYYSHRNWGGSYQKVVSNDIAQINIGSYSYARHAIVIPQVNFYQVENYTNVQLTSLNSTTIIDNYRVAPVINNTVIDNYSTNEQRHSFTHQETRVKPDMAVINRIEENAPAIQRSKKENADMVRRQVKSIKEGKVSSGDRIEPPQNTTTISPTDEVRQPKSEIQLQQRDIKSGGKTEQAERSRPVPSGKPEQLEIPAARPMQMAPVAPTEAPQKVLPPEQAIEKPRGKQQDKRPPVHPNADKSDRDDAKNHQGADSPQQAREQQNVENPKAQKPGKSHVEKQQAPKLSEEELEALKLQKKHEEGKNNHKGKKE